MGPERARIAAARALGDDAPALAVAGVCAGIAPSLRPATCLRHRAVGAAGTRIAVPGSALLVAALRRRGLRVHVGPLLSAEPHPGPGRAPPPRRSGARGRHGVGLACRAAPTDGRSPSSASSLTRPGRRLADPRIGGRRRPALAHLRRAGAALGEWAAAVGPRTVLLAGPRSFCAGVERAIDIVELALAQRGVPVYVRKQIVHNEHVVADLEGRGAVFVEELDEVPDGATVVFSAHGVSPAVRATPPGAGSP